MYAVTATLLSDEIIVIKQGDVFLLTNRDGRAQWHSNLIGMPPWTTAGCTPTAFYSGVENRHHYAENGLYELWLTNTFYLFGSVALPYVQKKLTMHACTMLRHKKRPRTFAGKLISTIKIKK